jgi:amino acid transporter
MLTVRVTPGIPGEGEEAVEELTLGAAERAIHPSGAEQPGTGLKSGAIGLVGLVTLGAVMMSPALGIYAAWGPMAGIVGSPTALVFLIALVVSIPTAISYSLLSRELPSSGSAFAWVWNTVSPAGGTWVGLMMATFYGIAVVIQPINFGLYFNALLDYVGVGGTGLGTWLVGVLLSTALVAVLVYRGIELSTRSAVAFILVESAVVLGLATTIVVNKLINGGFSAAPLDPGKVQGGGSALWSALILGIFAYTGYDVVSTVAEEAEAPRRLLPRATLLAVVVVGLFWTFCAFAFSISTPVAQIGALVSQGLTPVTPIAKDYWGAGEILVIVTALTASVGAYVATVVGASRALFAMAREGLLPARMARLDPASQLPLGAITFVFAFAVVGAALVVFVLGNAIEGVTWWAGGIAFFALITYIGVNVSNIAYFRRQGRARFNWLLNGVVPVVGIGLSAYLIYKGFFKTNLDAGWRLGGSITLVSVVFCVLAIVYVAWLRRTRPERFRGQLRIQPETTPASEGGTR